jgi:hypothetical protein
MDGPRPEWEEDTCVVCPAQMLGPGRFDVMERPGPGFAYDSKIGWRVDGVGTPVCVHPFRVSLPAGRYASAGDPLPDVAEPTPAPTPAALELPEQLSDLEGWLVATLRVVDSDRLMGAVTRAEWEASGRFAPGEVTSALRRVLSRELARR